MRTRTLVAAAALAVLVLSALSIGAVVAVRDSSDHDNHTMYRGSQSVSCTVPSLPGTIVHVSLLNSGGNMAAGGGMMGGGGMMRLTVDTATVPHGAVSFVATNLGSVNHELVILPLASGQIVGTRALGGDSAVDETGSLGEASNTCGDGTGEGIAPGSSSWTTVTLAPGRYELVCNLPGHYAAGMYTQLTVS